MVPSGVMLGFLKALNHKSCKKGIFTHLLHSRSIFIFKALVKAILFFIFLLFPIMLHLSLCTCFYSVIFHQFI